MSTGKNPFTPNSHSISNVDLTLDLITEQNMEVTGTLKVGPNPNATTKPTSLTLDGDGKMELLGIKVNGRELAEDEYTHDPENDKLTIHNTPDGEFEVQTRTRVNAWANNPKNVGDRAREEAKTLGLSEEAAKVYEEKALKENSLGHALTGIYVSGGKYMSQCESAGFRNITFSLDEPSTLSKFTTTVIADGDKYPSLLSNGNLVEETTLADGRKQVKWEDDRPKPDYLFAFVAGEFDIVKRDYVTEPNKRKVSLEVYVDKGDADKAELTLDALEKTLRYEEDRWQLEYEHDNFKVAVSNEFNFGAMENTTLNIFNPSAMLANAKMATDADMIRKEAIVAHEALHYNSGNLVTLNHWSQLTLKEGLTVYRDNEFTADHHYRPLARISHVADLRASQFAEDASPDAHPIRPSEYQGPENLYTSTVYEKGAEVIRMMETLLGRETFDAALTEYFSRFKGQAIATSDFVNVMAEFGKIDLAQFERTWYDQAGTPTLNVTDNYDEKTGTYSITIKQDLPDTPEKKGAEKEAHHIPVRLGLVGADGEDLPLDVASGDVLHGNVLNLKDREQTFVFKNVKERPLPSIGRGFSAPVLVNYDYSRADLTHLMVHDSDDFNRWDAGQRFAIDVIKDLVKAHQAGQELVVDPQLIEAYRGVLTNPEINKGIKSASLALPSFSYLEQVVFPEGTVDITALDKAIKTVEKTIANELKPELQQIYDDNRGTEARDYQFVDADIHERSLKNRALRYLSIADDNAQILATAEDVFKNANNHTDERSAIVALVEHGGDKARQAALDSFYTKWKHDPLVLDRWFGLQATADSPDVVEAVKALVKHPDFSQNPNRVRSVVAQFSMGNPVHFHREDGAGYKFLADQVIAIDKSNAQLAARLVGSLNEFGKYDEARQQKMVGELVRVAEVPGLSKNVSEIVGRGLKVAAEKGLHPKAGELVEALASKKAAASNDNAPGKLTPAESEIRAALLAHEGEDFLVALPQKWVGEVKDAPRAAGQAR